MSIAHDSEDKEQSSAEPAAAAAATPCAQRRGAPPGAPCSTLQATDMPYAPVQWCVGDLPGKCMHSCQHARCCVLLSVRRRRRACLVACRRSRTACHQQVWRARSGRLQPVLVAAAVAAAPQGTAGAAPPMERPLAVPPLQRTGWNWVSWQPNPLPSYAGVIPCPCSTCELCCF